MERYPDFSPLFDKGPWEAGYLGLLRLGPQAQPAVRNVFGCAEAAGERLDAQIDAMLNETNWRPQLVACVAMLAAQGRAGSLDVLRNALARHSWVSPQLAVTVSLLDPHFEANTRKRIVDFCAALDVVDLDAAGFAGQRYAFSEKAKASSALVALLERNGAPDWLAETYSSARREKLAKIGVLGGDELALAWVAEAEKILAQALR